MNYGVEYANKQYDPYAPTTQQTQIQSKLNELGKVGTGGKTGMSAGDIGGIVGSTLLNVLLLIPGLDVIAAPEVAAGDVAGGLAEGTAEGAAEGVGEGAGEGVEEATTATAQAAKEGASASELAAAAVKDAQVGGQLAEASSNAVKGGVQVGKYVVQGIPKAATQLGITQGLTTADAAVTAGMNSIQDRNQYMQLAMAKNDLVAQSSMIQNAVDLSQKIGPQDHFGVGTGIGTMKNPLLQQSVAPSLNNLFARQTNLARGAFS